MNEIRYDLAGKTVFVCGHNGMVGSAIVRRLELAQTIRRIIGYDGAIELDRSKPDGTPRKLMDGSRLAAMGWSPSIDLESGIRSTYEEFRRSFS